MKAESSKYTILVPVKYPVGGIRTYIKYTFIKFDKYKYEFILASQDCKRAEDLKEEFGDINFKVISSSSKNDFFALAKTVLKALIFQKIDLIHSQGYTAGLITCIINLFFQKPHIITLHHVFRAGQLSDSFWETFPRLKRKLIELILKRASLIQAVSEDARINLLQNFPGLSKLGARIVANSNGIDIDGFIKSTEIKEKIQLPGNIFLLGFLGRFMPEKGFPYIIDIVEELIKKHQFTEFRVVSIGTFGGFFREYKKIIEQRELTQYFIFPGFVKNTYNALSKIHILLIPSLGEACPLVPMEALIAGTPVIGFSCIGLREVLAGTPGILVPVKDVDGMVKEILNIKSNFQQMKTEFIDFIPVAKARFDVTNTAIRLEQLYKQLL
ncbi:MAG: glycosyltransferase family 4 protein [Syntrophotaleaceae bacterium]